MHLQTPVKPSTAIQVWTLPSPECFLVSLCVCLSVCLVVRTPAMRSIFLTNVSGHDTVMVPAGAILHSRNPERIHPAHGNLIPLINSPQLPSPQQPLSGSLLLTADDFLCLGQGESFSVCPPFTRHHVLRVLAAATRGRVTREMQVRLQRGGAPPPASMAVVKIKNCWLG